MPQNPDLQSVNNARREYLIRLNKTITPFILKFIEDTYTKAVTTAGHRKALIEVQKALYEVPRWNADVIREKTAAIEQREPALFSIITAAFVSFVKILSSIRISDNTPKIKLKVPPADKFVHRVYVLASKKFYENPKLIRSYATDVEHSQEQHAIIENVVENAVRDMLPMGDILSVYLSNAVDNDHMVNPVLSPTGSEQGDDDVDTEAENMAPPPSPDRDDEDIRPKVIPYDFSQSTQTSAIPPEPAAPVQQPLPPFPPAQPLSQPAPVAPSPFTSSLPAAQGGPPTSLHQQPQTSPSQLFPDAEDGEEHFH